jgi:hypothetical protein
MSIEAMRQALDALENGKRVRNYEGGTKYQPDLEDLAITALRAAIEQSEKRQWVGLTNKDIIEMWPETSTVGWDDIRLIEAKLKEKNHG